MSIFENEVINITKIHTVARYESCSGKKSSYNVKLPCYELIFNVTTTNTVYFAGRKLDNVPDSVRFLPKGISKGEYTVENTASGYCIDIYFDTEDQMPDFALVLKNMSELKPMFEKAYNVWKSKKTGYYSECMSVLYGIIKGIKLHGERYSSSDRTARIIPSYEYMLENFTSPEFDFNEMCSKSGMSYSYFKELFISRYGMSPVKTLTTLRMEKAKELLITGLYSVTEVSEMCGFDSVYYFSKVFKSYAGVSPKNYRLTETNVQKTGE